MIFAHFTLATRDLEGSRRFFEETFGWKAIEKPGNAAHPTSWLSVSPGEELHLVHVPDFEPSAFEREYGRHIALFHPRSDFEALRERLRRYGAAILEAERPTAFRRFFFRDRNGYLFEVIESEPRKG
jgi:catechol 2,3-dioxygenase-like lactoylglutathione lyase family enzyme